MRFSMTTNERGGSGMSDDLVKQSIAELQDIVRCRCHPAYKGRGMQDPDCECDSADAVQVVIDRIEELEAKLDLSEGALDVASKSWGECQRILEKTEVKLAKTVEALIEIATNDHFLGWIAITTLAELHGQADG
jgi:uncharacterized coiled-coil protein SlyX